MSPIQHALVSSMIIKRTCFVPFLLIFSKKTSFEERLYSLWWQKHMQTLVRISLTHSIWVWKNDVALLWFIFFACHHGTHKNLILNLLINRYTDSSRKTTRKKKARTDASKDLESSPVWLPASGITSSKPLRVSTASSSKWNDQARWLP
jgi:hypothetical protein